MAQLAPRDEVSLKGNEKQAKPEPSISCHADDLNLKLQGSFSNF